MAKKGETTAKAAKTGKAASKRAPKRGTTAKKTSRKDKPVPLPKGIALHFGPRWRWNLAKDCVNFGAEPPADKQVQQAVEYIKAYKDMLASLAPAARSGPLLSLTLFQGKFKELYPVVFTYENNDIMSSIIEAYILTRATSEQISGETGLVASHIELYKQFFFDVDEMLPYPPCVAEHILGRAGGMSFDAVDISTQYKALAYFMGREVFKQFIDCGELSDKVAKAMDKLIVSWRRRKAVTASLVQPVNTYSSMEVLQHHAGEVAVERSLVGGTTSDISGFLSALNCVVKVTDSRDILAFASRVEAEMAPKELVAVQRRMLGSGEHVT